jgi:hypothetical protein
MSRKGKAKFAVGQVVVEVGGSSCFHVEEVIPNEHGEYFYDIGTLMRWNESELRRLTSREIGPRKRKKGARK